MTPEDHAPGDLSIPSVDPTSPLSMEPTYAATKIIFCAGLSFFGRGRHCGIVWSASSAGVSPGNFLDFLEIALEFAMTDGGTVRAYRATTTATDEARPETPDVALARAVVAGEALGAGAKAGTVRVDGAWRSAPALGPAHDFDDLKQDVFLRVFDRVAVLRELGALGSFVYSVTIRVVSWENRRTRARRHRQAASLVYPAGPVGPGRWEAQGLTKERRLSATPRLKFLSPDDWHF
jgi:hypothetical protein